MLFRSTLRRTLTLAITAVLLLSLTAGATPPVWTPPGQSVIGNRWTAMLRLDRDQTYTYRLTGYNWNRAEMSGTINFAATAGGQIRFWYDVNGLRGSGIAPAEPKALAGAVLLSAMVNLGDRNVETLKLLTAPLYWMNWSELFADAQFRTGVVWQDSQQAPYSFEAHQLYRWTYNSQYEGVIYQGRTAKAEILFDLVEPLPLAVAVIDGRWEFVAEMQTNWITPILR